MESQLIQSIIYEVRGQKVMLDFHLASLYGVPTKSLNLAVKRNMNRFPSDFMFQLTDEEWKNLRFQIETSNGPGGKRYFPHAFTEQGVAMLSSVLRSDKAVQVNIHIMRTFVFIRQYALSHKDLTEQLKRLEDKYDMQFKDIHDAIRFLLNKEHQNTQHQERKRIGFKRS